MVERDHLFDDARLFSGGIRLQYPTIGESIEGLKEGILLEVGFANVQPNAPHTISSWAYDHAVASGVEIIDNRAIDIACYYPGYTLVEKLQTISTKFRRQQAGGEFPPNFMRHYYDVFRLLQDSQVQAFIGMDAYHAYKTRHFPKADNPIISENDAFSLSAPETRAVLAEAYGRSAALYYRGPARLRGHPGGDRALGRPSLTRGSPHRYGVRASPLDWPGQGVYAASEVAAPRSPPRYGRI